MQKVKLVTIFPPNKEIIPKFAIHIPPPIVQEPVPTWNTCLKHSLGLFIWGCFFKWHEVNIVSHGTCSQWLIAALPTTRSCSLPGECSSYPDALLSALLISLFNIILSMPSFPKWSLQGFWNVGHHSIKTTAVHPRRFWASYSPPWGLEISHI
jgi:hypothetical protein